MNIYDKKVQYIIFSVIAGCILLFLALKFIISPSLRSWKENSTKEKELQKEISEMSQVVRLRPAVQEQIATAKAAIKASAAHIPLPVLGNYLLKMEEHLQNCISNSGVTVSIIADNDILGITPDSKFKVYRVRVQAQSGLHDYLRLAGNIYQSNPLCAISGMNITVRANSPEIHDMNFTVSWLVWSDPAKRPAFLIEDNK